MEIYPASLNGAGSASGVFGDEIDRIVEFNPLTGEVFGRRRHAFVFPASHYVTSRDRMLEAAIEIEQELAQQVEKFRREGKLLEAQRIEQRTCFDLEMIRK